MKFPDDSSAWQLGDKTAAAWISGHRRQLVNQAVEAMTVDNADDLRTVAELRWVIDVNIGLFVSLLKHPVRGLEEATGSDLVASAANRAAEGSRIESLLENYVAGTAAIWRAMNSTLTDEQQQSSRQDNFAEVTGALFDYLGEVVILVARGFERESTRISAGRRDARFAVYSALVDGSDPVHAAARAAVPIATHYLVLAMGFGVSSGPAAVGRSMEVPRLRRLNEAQRVLDEFAAGEVLSLIGDPTGTALVPITAEQAGATLRAADDWLKDLTIRLSEAVGVPLHLGAAIARVTGIPGALRQAEEILELVAAIGFAPGGYTLDDVLVPYQLTRPGPARDALVSRLDVLDAHPDWEQTIRVFLASGSDRNRTAKQLRVHPNTVDYRLRRFAEVTGLDAGNPSIASAVQAGVWVRDLARRTAPA